MSVETLLTEALWYNVRAAVLQYIRVALEDGLSDSIE
jgi:hypothetical protein